MRGAYCPGDGCSCSPVWPDQISWLSTTCQIPVYRNNKLCLLKKPPSLLIVSISVLLSGWLKSVAGDQMTNERVPRPGGRRLALTTLQLRGGPAGGWCRDRFRVGNVKSGRQQPALAHTGTREQSRLQCLSSVVAGQGGSSHWT